MTVGAAAPPSTRAAPPRAATLGALQRLADSLTAEGFEGEPQDVQCACRLALIGASLIPSEPGASWNVVRARVQQLLHEDLAEQLLDHCEQLPAPTLEALSRAPRSIDEPGRLYETLLSIELVREADDRTPPRWSCVDSLQRRRLGSHYTSAALADWIVSRCLTPLLEGRDSEQLLQLKVCDPAMGAGAFLSAAGRFLAARLRQTQIDEGGSPDDEHVAFHKVVDSCLHGVDCDPMAVMLSHLTLARQAESPSSPSCGPQIHLHLRTGNSLGDGSSATPGLDYQAAFRDVFERDQPGFDAVIGNPPWIAYVGRATQPLSAHWRQYYSRRYQSFRKYRTLHGLFTERCTELLRTGGRLGLLLPTSVADLSGYEPVRAAHDLRCTVDPELPDLGDGQFAEVFQPSMVLFSTRRPADSPSPPRNWRLARSDLDQQAAELLQRLEEGPRIPSELFGERGYQTTKTDRSLLEFGELAPAPDWIPLRSGTEVSEFGRSPPRTFAHASNLEGTLRPASQWQQVRLLIRQTARFPITASSDGLAFRNSVLAGFESEELPWTLLLSYLNSTVVRWYHYQRHRDARQGMPQLKIAHLRALPRPPTAESVEGRKLASLGELLAARNSGITKEERVRLDALAAKAHSLTPSEEELVRHWGKQFPPPRPRSRR